MYAAQPQPVPASVTFRLIGLLDADLISSFIVMEKGLVGIDGATVLVHVRDLQVQPQKMLGQSDDLRWSQGVPEK